MLMIIERVSRSHRIPASDAVFVVVQNEVTFPIKCGPPPPPQPESLRISRKI